MSRWPRDVLDRLAAFLSAEGIPIRGITDSDPPVIQLQPGTGPETRAAIPGIIERFGEQECVRLLSES